MMIRIDKQQAERGVSLLLATISLVMIIPIVGLAVDLGYLYACKARLQAAVDGSALAAARALVLGSSTVSQAASAKQNAVNWFYANFPPNNWLTTGTVMNSNSVQVYDDPSNQHLRHVDITATTKVPTFFMKWFRFNATTIAATGHASRRDTVVMMVLDRSGSMCLGATTPCNTTGACGSMKTAAKLFTGQFAPGRDYIGLLSFSDGTYLHSAPTRDFRTVLGYTNSSGSGAGAIDTIQCQGGTNSAQAIALAYNELYKMALPGALNVLLFETDGLPNTLTLNFWDSMSNTASLNSLPNVSGQPRGCVDAANKTKANGGWTTSASRRLWLTSAYSMNSPSAGYMADLAPGPIGALYSTDPANGSSFLALDNPFHTSGSAGAQYMTTTTGCRFNPSSTGGIQNDVSDFSRIPGSDVWGNSLNPASHPYKAVTMSGSFIAFNQSTTALKWSNYRAGVFNATDHAAYRARSNQTLAATMFVIGLGGSSGDPPDFTLLQRMANDPQGDSFNNPAKYTPCSQNLSCYTYSDQPAGMFLYSSDQSTLQRAFLKLSSQILRLNQ
ncbi:MAG: hypothetical protein RL328_2117 [Acidobacteriota bacterium]|jgi:Flp pilus assembly protein TadG